MRYFLLFDTSCAACTGVAKRLNDMRVSKLEVRGLTDPEVTDLFRTAGRQLPDKPALVRVDGAKPKVWTGFGMRMRLARLIGINRAADIAGLVGLEIQARSTRSAEKPGGMSRRRMLGGVAAGAGALIFGAAVPAAASQHGATVRTLNTTTRQRLLASQVVTQAQTTWGAIDESAITAVHEAGETIALFPHRDSRAVTAVSTVDSEPVAITLLPDSETQSLGYFLPSGTPVVRQVVQDGRLHTQDLGNSPMSTSAPDGVKEFTYCFTGCIGASGIDVGCVLDCISCVSGSAFGCVKCGICAGPKAVKCAKECKGYL